MINVTLTFSGVPELMHFFTSIQAPATGVKVEPAAVTVEAAPTPKLEKPASKKTSAPAPAPADAPAPPTAPPTEAPPPAAAVDLTPEPPSVEVRAVAYADLQKAVVKLCASDKAAAAEIARGMGYETFKVMPAERWAEALALVNAKLGA